MNSKPAAPSAEIVARKNTRGVLGTLPVLLAFAVAWYVAREAVTYMRTPSQAGMHDAIMKQVADLKPRLPQVLNESTTLRDVRVEGLKKIFVNEIRAGYELLDVKPVQDLVTPKVCASPMRKDMLDGASYRYEYWSAGNDSKFLAAFDITSCP